MASSSSLGITLGLLRLTALVALFAVLYHNATTAHNYHVHILFPNASEQEVQKLGHHFLAASKLGIVFVLVQAMILYVGNNRGRLLPSIYGKDHLTQQYHCTSVGPTCTPTTPTGWSATSGPSSQSHASSPLCLRSQSPPTTPKSDSFSILTDHQASNSS